MSRDMRQYRGPLWSYAVRTAATYTSPDISNALGYCGIIIRLYADSESGTSTVDLKVQAYDEASAKWYDLPGASLAQVTANMTAPIDLVIHPTVTAVANRAVSTVLPLRMRIVKVVGGTSFATSTEYELIP